MMTHADVIRVAHLSDVPFDESCVVFADRRLPNEFLSRLPDPILVEGGETLKTLSEVEKLADLATSRRSTRPMTLVAVGGGSVGDAVGFLASILWRGVGLRHIPTTLLAMADSAHGGKTAMNTMGAKNQLGTYYEAERIYIVEEFLATLSPAQRRDGLTEMLKALMIAGTETIRRLTPEDIEALCFLPYESIAAHLRPLLDEAIRIKRDIVAADPREERGIRTVLNLGHTLGHALETASRVSHGTAVAWGLAAALELSAAGDLRGDVRSSLDALLYPLLRPIPFPSGDVLRQAMERDKKRQGGVIRSVLLKDVGQPAIVEHLTSGEWVSAFRRVYDRFVGTPVVARLRDPRRVLIPIGAGKSELNRALVIAARRPGATRIVGHSDCDDVRFCAAGISALGFPFEESPEGYAFAPFARRTATQTAAPRRVFCGEGGTTLRFLLALASTSARETRLFCAPALLARPHGPLIDALRSGGAEIERFDAADGSGFRVRGWESMPPHLEVDASLSSQYASALALLAAGAESPFTLKISGNVAEGSFFDLTLAMLAHAGVETIRTGDLVAFNPTERLRQPLEIAIPPDASARAVWETARYFEHPLLLPDTDSIHPDAAIGSLLEAIVAGQRGGEIALDCSKTPDLVPLLTIAALRSSKPVRITGAANLRWKESNRLEGLVSSLAALNIEVRATVDGVFIPAGAALSINPERFETHGDHRLVMAGLLLSMLTGEVELSEAWCVTKSYPEFWDHARMAGWSVRPVHAEASSRDSRASSGVDQTWSSHPPGERER
ncbi:MAG: hypothetical protein QHI48_02140 [Bacteroidota bacterium]|nr:hypothetical protein [Bacteroidota bacterium]